MPETRKYRILMLHNAYQIRGGEEESAESEAKLLRDAGHQVTYLTAHNDEILSFTDKLNSAVSAVWSRSWYQRVFQRLQSGEHDILHVQNFFPQISPSVYSAAQRAGVPVVQAIRNYRLACPAATLLRDGDLCTDCVGRAAKLPGVMRKCYRGSAAASASVAAMSGVHKLIGTWRHQVDQYLAISEYVASILEQEGISREKISIKPCFTYSHAPLQTTHAGERRDVLFVGRLSPEKGLPMLLQAWQRIAPLHHRLRIIGEGDLPPNLPQNIDVLGRKSPKEVQLAMSKAAVVVMPGLWAEPFGRVAVEAFAQGTPVIATGIGGVADIVEHGVTGALFPRGDVDALALLISDFLEQPELRKSYGLAARQSYLDSFTPDRNLRYLEDVYDRVYNPHPKAATHHPKRALTGSVGSK